MKRNIIFWQLAKFASASLFGVILHFLYSWCGTAITALFSAVNESTWEHMKLIFFPMFFFDIVQYLIIGNKYKNFWCIKLKGAICGLLLIPVLFYTLSGIFGSTPGWVNIGIFFISLAIACIYEATLFQKGSTECNSPVLALIVFCLIALSFAIFTFVPPQIPLFQNPLDGSFGLH